MRAVALSVAVLIITLFLVVLGHHMLTTGRLAAALTAIVGGTVIGVGLSIAIARSLKKDSRLWPSMLSVLFHVIAAAGFFGALQSPDFSVAYKIVSVAGGVTLIICGCIPMFTRENA
jgi:hypothetical protein